MAGRGATLEQMLYDLRAEVGQSTNPAVSRSTRGRQITILNRIQKRLYGEVNWPFLKVEKDIVLAAGQRYYDFPQEIDMDRSYRVEVWWGGEWQKIGFGINGTHYTQYNPEGPYAERSDPVWRWDYHIEDDSDIPQMEVWPLPATDGDPQTLEGVMRVYGTRKLKPLVNDEDTCILDSDMIVLYAAAEILAKRKSADAPAKLENANKIYNQLKGNSTPATPFTIGGNTFDCEPDRRPRELRVAYAGQVVPE